MSTHNFTLSFSNYTNYLVIINIISTKDTTFCKHRHFRYVLLNVFVNGVITPHHLLFQLLIVLVCLTSILAGLWLPSVPSLVKMCLCVFSRWQISWLGTFPCGWEAHGGRHCVLVEGRCMPVSHKPLSVAHHGYGFGVHQSFFMLLNILNWKGAVYILSTTF